MFGANYSYQKQPKILTDGDYEITLNKPFETMVGSYKVLRFPFFGKWRKRVMYTKLL